MLHFRSKAEIADLPIWIHTTPFVLDVSDSAGMVKKKLGDLPNLLGALDIGSCLNIMRVKTDVWVHDWSNTGVLLPGFFPSGYSELGRAHVSKDFERGNFALLALVFDYNSIFWPSFGERLIKTYANQAERLADNTLTKEQEGFVFKQNEPIPATYWELVKIKSGTIPAKWEKLKEPLPAKKAAFISMMGGGFESRLEAGSYFPLALFLGTNYVDGKFTDEVDASFPTHLMNDPLPIDAEVFPGAGFFVYDPPIVPPAVVPTNALEQIGKTLKAGFAGAPRFLHRFRGALPRYNYGGRLLGFLGSEAPPWPDYDSTPWRRYWPNDGTHDGDGSIPDGPEAEEHNYSWFLQAHAWPDFAWHFPSKYISDDGQVYYYEPGTVNAGWEQEQGHADFGFQGLHSSGDLTVGRHTDYFMVMKLDMGELAQEDPTAYPPADPARYIRDLKPRR